MSRAGSPRASARARFASAVGAGAGADMVGSLAGKGCPTCSRHGALGPLTLHLLRLCSRHLLARAPRGWVSVREACALVLCLGRKLASPPAPAGGRTLTADPGLKPQPLTSCSGGRASAVQALRGQRPVRASSCPRRPVLRVLTRRTGGASSPASLLRGAESRLGAPPSRPPLRTRHLPAAPPPTPRGQGCSTCV